MTRIALAAGAALAVATLPRAAGDDLIEKSPDGKTLARYKVVGGVKDGPFTTYYPGGAAESSGRYKAGELDGVVKYTDPAGKTITTATYKDGLPDGKRTDFGPAGKEVSVVVYDGGVVKSVKAADAKGMVTVPTGAGDPRCPPRYGEVRRALAQIEKLPPPAGDAPDAVAALRRLQQYRAYAGVPWEGMSLDATYTRHATAGAKLLQQIGKLSHTPDNPGWPEDEYKSAYAGTSNSNIASWSRPRPIADSVDMYMDDSDRSNIDRVGHRRWCLNPAMLKTGFGKSPAGTYSAMWSFDTSRPERPAFDYLPYPPPGVQPVGFVSPKHAWHVTFDPKRYKFPAKDGVTVRVERPGGEKLAVEALNVNTQGFGAGPAVIFHPTPAAIAPGARYRVTIEGVTRPDGTPAVVDYVVWFAP